MHISKVMLHATLPVVLEFKQKCQFDLHPNPSHPKGSCCILSAAHVKTRKLFRQLHLACCSSLGYEREKK